MAPSLGRLLPAPYIKALSNFNSLWDERPRDCCLLLERELYSENATWQCSELSAECTGFVQDRKKFNVQCLLGRRRCRCRFFSFFFLSDVQSRAGTYKIRTFGERVLPVSYWRRSAPECEKLRLQCATSGKETPNGAAKRKE